MSFIEPQDEVDTLERNMESNTISLNDTNSDATQIPVLLIQEQNLLLLAMLP
jgi:hypothetical protein